MIDYNAETIKTYGTFGDKYVQFTKEYDYQNIDSNMRIWLNFGLQKVGKNGKILEIGSGGGFDADYMESLGFDIIRSDASHYFVSYLKAINLDILEMDMKHSFDMIYASKVLCHFEKSQFNKIFDNVRKSLASGGIFVFNVKFGKKDEKFEDNLNIGGPLYNSFWQIQEIRYFLESKGFKIIFSNNDRHNRWLNYIICNK